MLSSRNKYLTKKFFYLNETGTILGIRHIEKRDKFVYIIERAGVCACRAPLLHRSVWIRGVWVKRVRGLF